MHFLCNLGKREENRKGNFQRFHKTMSEKSPRRNTKKTIGNDEQLNFSTCGVFENIVDSCFLIGLLQEILPNEK